MRPALALLALSLPALAQTSARPNPNADFVTRTFLLTNATEARESNEVITALRNILDPMDKIFLLPSVNAFVISAPPDQIALTERMLKELDRPRRAYRLTYTLTTSDHGDRIGTEHFSMVVVAGEHTVMKEGNRLPVLTGTYNPGSDKSQTQYTYLDIGMNFDASLDESAAGVRLRSKIENSSLAPDQASPGVTDPVIRQTLLEGTSILTPGKPLILGSIDLPGTTRRVDVTVLMELAS